jgi:PEP-CTERM motif
MKDSILTLSALVVLFGAAGQAKAGLITNGGFEDGNFTGWTVTDQAQPAGAGSWYIGSGTSTLISGHTTVGPSSGTYYAVTDQDVPGAYALTQKFTVPAGSSVTLSFNMFVNNYNVGPYTGALDYTLANTMQGRVDILTAGASAFDTGTGVVKNLYDGADGGSTNGDTPPDPYISYSYNITPYVGQGGTFQLRFAASDNDGYLIMGVDNVNITATAVPEPTTLILTVLGLVLAGLASWQWRAEQRKLPGDRPGLLQFEEQT